MNGSPITYRPDALAFLLGGKATFTLLSQNTGVRFTYKVAVAKDNEDRFFVSLLDGPDNWSNYAYIGLMNRDGSFRRTPKSGVTEDAPSFKAISWFLRHIFGGTDMPKGDEFWHEGKCGACGRKLTVPASIQSGLGPVCAERLGS